MHQNHITQHDDSRHIARAILYIFLLAAPCCLKLDNVGQFHFAKMWFPTGTLSALLPATILWLAAYRYKWARIPIAIFLFALFVLDFWLFFQIGTRMSDRIIYFALQTNGTEASEFLSTYLPSIPSIKVGVIALLTIALYGALLKYLPSVKFKLSSRKPLLWATIAANAVSALIIYLGTFNTIGYNAMARSTIQVLITAIHDAKSYSADISRLEKALDRTDSTLDKSIYSDISQAPDIVFIIGESYNPHHCPLYGYPLMTTPGIVAAYRHGDIVFFSDVATPSASTGIMMEVLYSPAEAHATDDRWDCPIIPALFKHAGYAVALHDNQITRLAGDSKWDIGNSQFLNSGKVESLCFNYRNTELHPDDLTFCTRELPHDRNIKEPLLSIYHLMGQHSPAAARHPQSLCKFTAADYSWRKNISPSQADEIAHYDNATFHNDSVVCTIFNSLRGRDAIAVYLSDHGEEIHDYRNQYGRTWGPITKEIAANIYSVPLIIFTTPEFRERHPAMYQAITDALSRKVYTGDIGQMMLYLGGIKSRWTDPARNPLSPAYDSTHRRILNSQVDYDDLMHSAN